MLSRVLQPRFSIQRAGTPSLTHAIVAPTREIERLGRVHHLEQHRHELPCNGADRAGLGLPAAQHRVVVLAAQPSSLAPATREQEELPPKERPATLGLPNAAAHRGAALFARQIHPGELEHLARRFLPVRFPEIGDECRCTDDIDAGHSQERLRSPRHVDQLPEFALDVAELPTHDLPARQESPNLFSTRRGALLERDRDARALDQRANALRRDVIA